MAFCGFDVGTFPKAMKRINHIYLQKQFTQKEFTQSENRRGYDNGHCSKWVERDSFMVIAHKVCFYVIYTNIVPTFSVINQCSEIAHYLNVYNIDTCLQEKKVDFHVFIMKIASGSVDNLV